METINSTNTLQEIEQLLDSITHTLECKICHGTLKDTHTVPGCFHRFCGSCYKDSLVKNQNVCPACGEHMPNNRQVKKDVNYDILVQGVTKTLDALHQSNYRDKSGSKIKNPAANALAFAENATSTEKIRNDGAFSTATDSVDGRVTSVEMNIDTSEKVDHLAMHSDLNTTTIEGRINPSASGNLNASSHLTTANSPEAYPTMPSLTSPLIPQDEYASREELLKILSDKNKSATLERDQLQSLQLNHGASHGPLALSDMQQEGSQVPSVYHFTDLVANSQVNAQALQNSSHLHPQPQQQEIQKLVTELKIRHELAARLQFLNTTLNPLQGGDNQPQPSMPPLSSNMPPLASNMPPLSSNMPPLSSNMPPLSSNVANSGNTSMNSAAGVQRGEGNVAMNPSIQSMLPAASAFLMLNAYTNPNNIAATPALQIPQNNRDLDAMRGGFEQAKHSASNSTDLGNTNVQRGERNIGLNPSTSPMLPTASAATMMLNAYSNSNPENLCPNPASGVGPFGALQMPQNNKILNDTHGAFEQAKHLLNNIRADAGVTADATGNLSKMYGQHLNPNQNSFGRMSSELTSPQTALSQMIALQESLSQPAMNFQGMLGQQKQIQQQGGNERGAIRLDEAGAIRDYSSATSSNHSAASKRGATASMTSSALNSNTATNSAAASNALASTDNAQPRRRTIIRRNCEWKLYPELEKFLIDNREEYLHHATAHLCTMEQKNFNNELTRKLILVAKEFNYEFDPEHYNFAAIRTRVRYYYNRYVRKCKWRGIKKACESMNEFH